jgi:hypothetical protein
MIRGMECEETCYLTAARSWSCEKKADHLVGFVIQAF